MGLTSPFFLGMFHATSGGFDTQWFLTSRWHTSFGLSTCLDFGLCPLFLFFALSWVLSFYELWQGFITFKLVPSILQSSTISLSSIYTNSKIFWVSFMLCCTMQSSCNILNILGLRKIMAFYMICCYVLCKYLQCNYPQYTLSTIVF